MSEETPVVIDTRDQTEAHTLKLITSEHPEGMVFTVTPMGAGTYLKFMDKVKTLQALNAQDMSSKQLLKIQNDLCNLLIPLRNKSGRSPIRRSCVRLCASFSAKPTSKQVA